MFMKKKRVHNCVYIFRHTNYYYFGLICCLFTFACLMYSFCMAMVAGHTPQLFACNKVNVKNAYVVVSGI